VTIKYIGKKRPIKEEEFECMKLSYTNKDWILTDFRDTLSYQDHNILKELSDSQKEYWDNLDKVSKEKEKMKFLSSFISNSNEIEGSTMTFKQTYDYLFNDLSPKGHSKKELFMTENLFKAWKYLEKNCKRFPKKEDLFNLHKLVNRDIEEDITLGKYKIVQNYIGDIHTTSYLFTEEKMNKLLDWIKKAYKEMDDFEIAFQSHAQFEIIHPFIDGNGRVGRLFINWLLMYKNLEPLAINAKKRDEYLSALNNSKRGKIEAITKFCFNEYKKQYKFI
jgi:Fic family protein